MSSSNSDNSSSSQKPVDERTPSFQLVSEKESLESWREELVRRRADIDDGALDLSLEEAQRIWKKSLVEG